MTERDMSKSTGVVVATSLLDRSGGKRVWPVARETGAAFVARIDLKRAQECFGAMLVEDVRAEQTEAAVQRYVALDQSHAGSSSDVQAFPPKTLEEAPSTITGRVSFIDGRRGLGVVVPEDGGENVLLRLEGGGVTGIASLCVGQRLQCSVKRGARYLEVITADLPPGEEPAVPHHRHGTWAGRAPEVWELATLKWFNRVRGFGFMSLGEGRPVLYVDIATLRRCGIEDVQLGQKLQVRAEWGRLRVVVIEARLVETPFSAD